LLLPTYLIPPLNYTALVSLSAPAYGISIMAWSEVEEQEDYFSCDENSSGHEGNDAQTAGGLGSVEDADSDTDTDIPRTHGAKTTSEKRRAQNDVMRAFAANINAYLTQKEVDDAVSKSANEEQLSIRDILASQDTAIRITNPRDYQTELFMRAKDENTIAVLDTGTGKTHIATLLLRHVLEEELESRAKGGIHKIAFFLVRNSVTSSAIHMLTLRRSTR
jgi:endoribonuclease Dicer